MTPKKGPLSSLFFGGFVGFVSGVVFGIMSRGTGFEPFTYRLIGGAVVGGIAGMLMGNIAGQMTARDVTKNSIAGPLLAGACMGCLGAWIWREVMKVPPLHYLPWQ